MDIQKMVDDRIEELRTQMIRISSTLETGEEPNLSSAKHFPDHRGRDAASTGWDLSQITSRQESQFEPGGLKELEELMDSSLVEVAERILAITGQVAGDYARMEKDILDSRLAVLQGAEAVLDIAISLRRKARSLSISSSKVRQISSRNNDRHQPFRDADAAGGSRCAQDGRASMHEQGVASLFKKT